MTLKPLVGRLACACHLCYYHDISRILIRNLGRCIHLLIFLNILSIFHLFFVFLFIFFILSIFLGETYFTNFILFFGLLNKLILIILFLHLILFTAKKYKNIVFLTYLYIYIYIIYLMSLNTFKLK